MTETYIKNIATTIFIIGFIILGAVSCGEETSTDTMASINPLPLLFFISDVTGANIDINVPSIEVKSRTWFKKYARKHKLPSIEGLYIPNKHQIYVENHKSEIIRNALIIHELCHHLDFTTDCRADSYELSRIYANEHDGKRWARGIRKLSHDKDRPFGKEGWQFIPTAGPDEELIIYLEKNVDDDIADMLLFLPLYNEM